MDGSWHDMESHQVFLCNGCGQIHATKPFTASSNAKRPAAAN